MLFFLHPDIIFVYRTHLIFHQRPHYRFTKHIKITFNAPIIIHIISQTTFHMKHSSPTYKVLHINTLYNQTKNFYP